MVVHLLLLKLSMIDTKIRQTNLITPNLQRTMPRDAKENLSRYFHRILPHPFDGKIHITRKKDFISNIC